MTSYVCHSHEQGATDLASPPAFPVAVLYNLFLQGAAFHSKRQLWTNIYLPPFSWNVPLAFCKQFNWESKGYSSQWRLKGLLVGQNAITQGRILPVCQHGNREICVCWWHLICLCLLCLGSLPLLCVCWIFSFEVFDGGWLCDKFKFFFYFK